jgi:phosphoketolase
MGSRLERKRRQSEAILTIGVAFRPVAHESRHVSDQWTTASPMTAIDRMFVALLAANPGLRPRVGNPDEMLSNRLVSTLGRLKFRVTDPEPAVPESTDGAVITALNEEAVVSAALANKGGINLVHTYEAFGSKMHGAVRQEIIFANHCLEAGQPQQWLSMPLILTSHTWENGKNEQSHQDSSMAEAMLGDLSHVSRVLFPPDFNSAAAVGVSRMP